MKTSTAASSNLSVPEFHFWQQCLVGGIVVSILVLGQLLVPIWIIVLCLIAVPIAIIILRNDLYTLIAYIGIIIAVKLRAKQDEVSFIDVIAGILFTGILFSQFFQKKIFQNKQIVSHPLLYWVLGFAVWAFGIGLIHVVQGDTGFLSLYREFLTFSPLLFIPFLFNGLIEKDIKILLRFLLLLWLVEEVASVLLIKQSVQSVIFVYETGRANFDVIRSSVSIFLFLIFASVKSQRKYQKYYIIGILISIMGLGLTFNRTGYVLTLLLIPFLIITTPKSQRSSALKVLFIVVSIVLVIGGIAYFVFPTLHLIIRWSFAKFLTSSNVKADASIYNRYVEWRYVWKQILANPITGMGFAGQFKDYVWIVGYTINSFYTHSGVLGILLKSGIVGLMLISTAYIGFFILGIKLVFPELLSDIEKSFARFGVFVIILITLHSLTLNPLMHREILWYLGLVWAFFIYFEKKLIVRSKKISP